LPTEISSHKEKHIALHKKVNFASTHQHRNKTKVQKNFIALFPCLELTMAASPHESRADVLPELDEWVPATLWQQHSQRIGIVGKRFTGKSILEHDLATGAQATGAFHRTVIFSGSARVVGVPTIQHDQLYHDLTDANLQREIEKQAAALVHAPDKRLLIVFDDIINRQSADLVHGLLSQADGLLITVIAATQYWQDMPRATRDLLNCMITFAEMAKPTRACILDEWVLSTTLPRDNDTISQELLHVIEQRQVETLNRLFDKHTSTPYHTVVFLRKSQPSSGLQLRSGQQLQGSIKHTFTFMGHYKAKHA